MSSKGYSITHIGNKRKNNQDAILVEEDLGLYAVADGMGGHSGGEVASALAVKSLKEFMVEAVKAKNFSPEQSLVEAFQEANRRVFEKSQEESVDLSGMGTTLVACLLWQNKAFFGNVGDSRAYLFREPYLWRVTEDHSVINSQLKSGLIEEEQVSFFMGSNVITRSIGFFPEIEVDLFQRDLQEKDLFLLCSDGLNEISDQEICALAQKHSVEDLPKKCVEKTLEGEGSDNISIIVVQPSCPIQKK